MNDATMAYLDVAAAAVQAGLVPSDSKETRGYGVRRQQRQNVLALKESASPYRVSVVSVRFRLEACVEVRALEVVTGKES